MVGYTFLKNWYKKRYVFHASSAGLHPPWGDLHTVLPELILKLMCIKIARQGKTECYFVAQWRSPLTLQPELSGGVGLMPGRAPPLERHDCGCRHN